MIILASGSPRRKELLGLIDKNFEIITSYADETPSKTIPGEIVEELSARKAKDVFEKVDMNKLSDDTLLIIAADTLVFHGAERMGKPSDEEDAVRMLTRLSGDTHQVYTGVTLIFINAGDITLSSFHEKTDVSFAELTEKEIENYVATGEPMDKAGAYAIQGLSAKFVSEIKGDYCNVVGLPVARLYKEMKKIGFYS